MDGDYEHEHNNNGGGDTVYRLVDEKKSNNSMGVISMLVIYSAVELSNKSILDLLRLSMEAQYLIFFLVTIWLWENTLSFTLNLEW